MRRTARCDERGAAAVEFALVLPLLIMVLFGTITVGLSYNDYVSAQNAVREGARYGAATDLSASWATSVRDRVKQVYYNAGVTVVDAEICVQLVKSDGTVYSQWAGANCGTAPTLPGSMASGSCAVRVWMTRPEVIRLIVVPDMDFDISANSVAYYGRTVAPTCTAS